MRILIGSLCLLFLILQYALWFSSGGLLQIWRLHQNINAVNVQNNELAARNSLLAADVADLKQGQESIEEHARNDLGMIKQGETFFQTAR